MYELDRNLPLEDFIRIVRSGERVRLSDAARDRIHRARARIEEILQRDEAVYGVTTGFGKFQNTRIEPDKLRELQRNLILSHAIGVGDPFPTEVVRGMLLLRAQSLSLGHSGCREIVVERLLQFLNDGIHPVIPCQGSVGSSGDLAPLAHTALALIGEGEVEYQGGVKPTADVLAARDLEPLVLEAKEGLALINGTQAMCSLLALLVSDVRTLLTTADIAAAMSVEPSREATPPSRNLSSGSGPIPEL